MDRVTVWLPADELVAGEAAVAHGSAPGDGVDTTLALRGGRSVPVRTRDGGHLPPGQSSGPAGIGPSGSERGAAALRSEPLPFGVYTFAASVRDRETGELGAGGVQTVTALVNAAPAVPQAARAEPAPVGGVLRFYAAAGQV